MSDKKSWHDINSPGVFISSKRQAEQNASEKNEAEAAEIVRTSQKEKSNTEARLSSPRWYPGSKGFAFNNKCKVRIDVEYLSQNAKKRVMFNLFCESEAGREDLNHQVEGIERDGVAEAEVTLFYGDKFYDLLHKNPNAKCNYIFKVSHPKGEKVVESPKLEMPDKIRKSFVIKLNVDPNNPDTQDDKFRLYSSDRSYNKSLTIKDDKQPGDSSLDLEFSDVDENAKYTFEIDLGKEGKKPVVIFSKKSIKEFMHD